MDEHVAAVNVILVCGHECPDPAYLQTVSPDWTVVAGGRALTAAIDTARAECPLVTPMIRTSADKPSRAVMFAISSRARARLSRTVGASIA